MTFIAAVNHQDKGHTGSLATCNQCSADRSAAARAAASAPRRVFGQSGRCRRCGTYCYGDCTAAR